jgi:16S rRNA (guanine527-N7)-methyltransferase
MNGRVSGPDSQQAPSGRRPRGGSRNASSEVPASPAATAVPALSPQPPAHLAVAADRLFGDRLPMAITYAEALMTDGVIRGLIGPREAPRIWDRHLLNCAAVGELIPPDASVADIGSGAGLPGIVLAVARPDLSVILVEPLARRTVFLTEVVAALGLDRVRVVRARAEDCVGRPDGPPGFPVDVVTARAVAPLDRLAAWCLPLASIGGRVLALKGESAADEAAAHADAIGRLGGSTPVVRRCGEGLLAEATTVIEIVRTRAAGAGGAKSSRGDGRVRSRSARSTRPGPTGDRNARGR